MPFKLDVSIYSDRVVPPKCKKAFLENTREKPLGYDYSLRLRYYLDWCESQGVKAVTASPSDVTAYLLFAAKKTRSLTSINLVLVLIIKLHRLMGDDAYRTPANVLARKKQLVENGELKPPRERVVLSNADICYVANHVDPNNINDARLDSMLFILRDNKVAFSTILGLRMKDVIEQPDGSVVVKRNGARNLVLEPVTWGKVLQLHKNFKLVSPEFLLGLGVKSGTVPDPVSRAWRKHTPPRLKGVRLKDITCFTILA